MFSSGNDEVLTPDNFLEDVTKFIDDSNQLLWYNSEVHLISARLSLT